MILFCQFAFLDRTFQDQEFLIVIYLFKLLRILNLLDEGGLKFDAFELLNLDKNWFPFELVPLI